MAEPVWLEPVRGGYPDLRFLALPGLGQVQAFVDRQVLPPPIHHLTGMLPTEGGPAW